MDKFRLFGLTPSVTLAELLFGIGTLPPGKRKGLCQQSG
jgi:hypothetical protein